MKSHAALCVRLHRYQLRVSPVCRKKLTPRCGQSICAEHSNNLRAPPRLRSSWASSNRKTASSAMFAQVGQEGDLFAFPDERLSANQCIGEKLAGIRILFSWLTLPGAPDGHWGILLAAARTSARWLRSW